MKTVFLLTLLITFAFSCKESAESREEQRRQDSLEMAKNDTLNGDDTVNMDSPAANEYAEFRVVSGSNALTIRDWKNKMDVQYLGPANDTLTRELTLMSDTHQGSTVTEYKYDNVNLTYLTPKGSNDSWLMTVEIKGGDWSTARGIKVGDSVDELKSMYPNITMNADTKEPYQYSYTLEDSVLMFGVDADKVSRIKIAYNIP